MAGEVVQSRSISVTIAERDKTFEMLQSPKMGINPVDGEKDIQKIGTQHVEFN